MGKFLVYEGITSTYWAVTYLHLSRRLFRRTVGPGPEENRFLGPQ